MVCASEANTSAINSHNTQTHDSINCTHQRDHRSRTRPGHPHRDQRWWQKSQEKVGKWIEKTFGNGDGEHTFSDYADDVLKVVGILVGASGVFNKTPGSEGPGPGVLH